MKYRIKYHDTTWLFFTPLAFLNMGGTNLWTIEQKRHWWNKWEVIERYNEPENAYIKYFKLKYDLNIEKIIKFPHNIKKEKIAICYLEFKYNSHSTDYRYCVGYKPRNYINYYHCCYSSESCEDALIKLYNDLEIRKLLQKNKLLEESYVNVEKQRCELEKIVYRK